MDSLTAEDFPVGAPEVSGFGRPAVELISVGSQNQPEKNKIKGEDEVGRDFLYLGDQRTYTGADLSDSVTVM